MKAGDVFQYKETFVYGTPSDNHIIMAIIEDYVICTLEKFFNLSYFDSQIDEVFSMPFRKIEIETFKKWYPTFLYNVFNKDTSIGY